MVLFLNEENSTDLDIVGRVPCVRFGLKKETQRSCKEQNPLPLYLSLSADYRLRGCVCNRLKFWRRWGGGESNDKFFSKTCFFPICHITRLAVDTACVRLAQNGKFSSFRIGICQVVIPPPLPGPSTNDKVL